MAKHVRGTQAVFEALFQNPDGSPMTAADPESWPQLSIRDPEENVIATGVGSAVGDGRFRFTWFVPVNATMNTEDTSWRINWSFVTFNGHTRGVEERFDVIDKIESTPEERSHSYLTNDGGVIRAMLRVPRKLKYVDLQIKSALGSEILVHVPGVASNALEASSDNQYRLINEVAQDGEYIYYYDIGPLTAGEYQFHWTVQETDVSERMVYVQIGRAAPDVFWHYDAELRVLIDKLQKSANIKQGYTSADVYSYIKSGIDLLNNIAPPTNFVLLDIPLNGSRGLRTVLIYTSALHAILAQHIMDVELNFDHTGQIVTLSYNHDYTGILTQIENVLEKFKESKPHIFRLAQGAVYSGARVKNYRYTNRVYRLDQALSGIAPPSGAAFWRNIGL